MSLTGEKMEISQIKKTLIDQKNMNLSSNLYHKTQLDKVCEIQK